MTPPSSPSSSSAPQVFVGIDVAKEALDLARSDTGELLRVDNTPAGIRKLVQTLSAAKPTCIVLEATGGLEEPLLEALLDAALPVARVNPGKVRHLAKGLGILAKTDAIDARVLVEFARIAEPRLAVKRSEKQAELDALVTCRKQLVTARVDQSNRLQSTTSKPARRALNAVLHVLDKQIKNLNQQIASIIDSDDDMRHLHERLRTVPGVGPVLSSTLIAQLRELGHPRPTAANWPHWSVWHPSTMTPENSKANAPSRGGRSPLRNVLYMATQIAIMHNPVIKTFANRLEKAGKLPKVVIVACMRKLLGLLNAMIRDNLDWNDLTAVKNAS